MSFPFFTFILLLLFLVLCAALLFECHTFRRITDPLLMTTVKSVLFEIFQLEILITLVECDQENSFALSSSACERLTRENLNSYVKRVRYAMNLMMLLWEARERNLFMLKSRHSSLHSTSVGDDMNLHVWNWHASTHKLVISHWLILPVVFLYSAILNHRRLDEAFTHAW